MRMVPIVLGGTAGTDPSLLLETLKPARGAQQMAAGLQHAQAAPMQHMFAPQRDGAAILKGI